MSIILEADGMDDVELEVASDASRRDVAAAACRALGLACEDVTLALVGGAEWTDEGSTLADIGVVGAGERLSVQAAAHDVAQAVLARRGVVDFAGCAAEAVEAEDAATLELVLAAGVLDTRAIARVVERAARCSKLEMFAERALPDGVLEAVFWTCVTTGDVATSLCVAQHGLDLGAKIDGCGTLHDCLETQRRLRPALVSAVLAAGRGVEAAVRASSWALAHAPAALRANRGVVAAAVAQNGRLLEHAGDALRGDREVVLHAVSNDGAALGAASPALRGDRGVVAAAVTRCGAALQHASDELRADREVVLMAVAEDASALQHAAPEVCADREVVLRAVARDGCALQHAAPALRGDGEVVLRAFAQRGYALPYSMSTP